MDSNNHVEELLPDFVLGCLDVEQTAWVSNHLTHCKACQAELAQYETITDRLALAMPEMEPPARLEDRLAQRIRSAQAIMSQQQKVSWWQQLKGIMQQTAPAWSMAALVLILFLTAAVFMLWQQVNRLEQNVQSVDEYVINLEATEAVQGANGIIIADNAKQKYVLVVKGLSALDETQQYQLWLIDNGQRTSGAIFSVNDDGYGWVAVTSPRPLSDYSNFGITIEPAGGSPGPTGKKVLGSTL